MSDELKIVLEDVKEKFDTVIEAFNMVREKAVGSGLQYCNSKTSQFL